MGYKKLNEQLKFFRNRAHLNQLQVSELLHVSRQTISSWETGRNEPNIESIKMIAELYNVSVDELLTGKSQSSISRNEAKARVYLAAATGGIFIGRGLIMTTINMRLYIDVLIIIAILLNIILFKKVDKTRIMALLGFDDLLLLSMILNLFNMGIDGKILLIPVSMMFFIASAYFVKDRILFFVNVRSNNHEKKYKNN